MRSFRDDYVKEKHLEAVEEYNCFQNREYDRKAKGFTIYADVSWLVQGTIQLIQTEMIAEAFALYRDYGKNW